MSITLAANQRVVTKRPTKRQQTLLADELCCMTQTIYNGIDRKLVFEVQNEITKAILSGNWKFFADKDTEHDYVDSLIYMKEMTNASNIIFQLRSDCIKFGPRRERESSRKDDSKDNQDYARQSNQEFKDSQFLHAKIEDVSYPIELKYNESCATMNNLLRACFVLCSSLLRAVNDMEGTEFDSKIVGWSLSNFEFFACLALAYGAQHYSEKLVYDLVWISLTVMFDSNLSLRKYFSPNFVDKVADYISAGHQGVFQWEKGILKGVVTVHGMVKMVPNIDTINYRHFTPGSRIASLPDQNAKFINKAAITNMFTATTITVKPNDKAANNQETLLSPSDVS